jgi:peptide/nickel transport system permease protein
VAGPMATAVELANTRQQLGLNDPFYLQYYHYFSRALQGDLGRSWVMHRPVWDAVFAHLGPSFQLALASALVELILGGLVGMISTIFRYRWPDRVSMVLSLILLSLPGFWFALVLLYLFGYLIPILPLGGFGGLQHLILPACAVGVPYSAWYARMLRSTMLEVINEDYMRTAHAKGLSARIVFLRHGLRNAIIPIITMWGMDLGSFVAGLALVESVFGWPGVGWQAVQAARNLDVPLVMGSVLLISVLVAVSNLLVDISYHWLDPRVTYS